jgi:hypothetical protein
VAETRAVHPGAVRIGLFGTFDIDNLGDALFPRIVRMELSRRLPDATVTAFAPYGAEHPIPFDAGDPAEALGPHTPDRAAELARELDCILVGPGEIAHTHDELLAHVYDRPQAELVERAPSRFFIEGLGPELESSCPVLWNAVGVPFDFDPDEAPRVRRALAARPYVSVRDDASRRRLELAGVDREIAVVPDPALMLPRLIARGVLDRRLAQLRVTGGFPEDRDALVVQGSRSFVDRVPGLAPAVARLADDLDAAVVLVETGPCHGDGAFAEAMREALPDRPFHAASASVEDLAAAIAASAGFVGSSLHGSISAFVHGRPHLLLGEESKLRAFARLIDREEAVVADPDDVPTAFAKVAARGPQPDLVAALQHRVDEHFDRMAAIIADTIPGRPQAPAEPTATQLREHLRSLAAAHASFARRVAADRARLAERVEEREAERRRNVEHLEAEIARRDQEVERLRGQVDHERAQRETQVADRDRQLKALLNTRTFRYTAALRRAWGWLIRLGRRR